MELAVRMMLPAEKLNKESSISSPQKTHFWVATQPFFQTELFFVKLPSSSACEDRSHIALYDADGVLVNDISFAFAGSSIGYFSLEPAMSGCKLEGGIKHAHAVVQSNGSIRHLCRIRTAESGALMGAPVDVCEGVSACFPVTFAEQRRTLVSLVNLRSETARARCRLFCGQRTPETVVVLPPLGARVLVLEAEFPEFSDLEQGRKQMAYLRVGTARDDLIGAQVIERAEGRHGAGIFSSVL